MSGISRHAGSIIDFPATEVFAAASACPGNVFTDLDCSSVVGARSTLIVLSFENNTGNVQSILVRQNGDTRTPGMFQIGGLGHTASADFVTIRTDSAGIIEWKTTTTDTGMKITAEVYVNG